MLPLRHLTRTFIAAAPLMASMVLPLHAQRITLRSELRGVVIDTMGHRLGGAVVSILGTARSTTTDTGGAFSMRGLAAGSYAVLARRPRFEQRLVEVNVPDAEARRALGVGYYIPSETIAEHPGWPMTSLLRATTSGITYVRHCSRGYSAAGTQDGSLSERPVREPGCVMPATGWLRPRAAKEQIPPVRRWRSSGQALRSG